MDGEQASMGMATDRDVMGDLDTYYKRHLQTALLSRKFAVPTHIRNRSERVRDVQCTVG